MVTLTPPSSNSGTPARPSSPPAEVTMDVDSVPQSPLLLAESPKLVPAATASAAPTAVPSAPQRAEKGSDTEEDEDPRRSKSARSKNRDMFDGEIVDRWNQEFGDVFMPSAPAPTHPTATVPP